MYGQLADLLDDLFRRGREQDEAQADRLDRWRNVEPDTARLLAVLVRALAPKRLLELGTSNGYSTIWLADAARASGGSLTSVEIDPDRAAAARQNLRRVLTPGGLLVVDNVLSHADQVAESRALAAADERVTEALAPTGAGALLIVSERR